MEKVDFSQSVSAALQRIPSALYVMTASFDGARRGMLVEWVQRCGNEPPMIGVSLRKGQAIEPIIRDSHAFALSLIRSDDRFILRLLNDSNSGASLTLDASPCDTLRTGSPCLRRAIATLDCEVARHIDLDNGHELYIGEVVDGRVHEPAPECDGNP